MNAGVLARQVENADDRQALKRGLSSLVLLGSKIVDCCRFTRSSRGSLSGQLQPAKSIGSTAISTRSVGDIIKTHAKHAGVIGWAEVSSHSLRRGWATAAATNGVPAALIKQHGRWKTLSTAERYIDCAGSTEAMAATRSVIAGIPYAEAMAI